MKKLLYILPLVLIFLGCTKEQTWVNRMEGSWTLDQVQHRDLTNGILYDVTPADQRTYVFNKCKLNKDTDCPGSWSDVNGTTSFIYSVVDDGYKMRITQYGTDTTVAVYDLQQVTETELNFALIQDSNWYYYHLSK